MSRDGAKKEWSWSTAIKSQFFLSTPSPELIRPPALWIQRRIPENKLVAEKNFKDWKVQHVADTLLRISLGLSLAPKRVIICPWPSRLKRKEWIMLSNGIWTYQHCCDLLLWYTQQSVFKSPWFMTFVCSAPIKTLWNCLCVRTRNLRQSGSILPGPWPLKFGFRIHFIPF